MSSTHNGSAAAATFPVAITEPADGDALNAASVNVALSQLADDIEGIGKNTKTFKAVEVDGTGGSASTTPSGTIKTSTAGSVIAEEAWREVGGVGQPAFGTNWSNYGGGTSAAGFYKDSSGVVHLKGTVKCSGATTTVFTLPAGYRPAELMRFGGIDYSGSVWELYNGVVDTSGVLSIDPTISKTYWTLDCISFRAA